MVRPPPPPFERVRDRRWLSPSWAFTPVTSIRTGFTLTPAGDGGGDWFGPDGWQDWLLVCCRLRYYNCTCTAICSCSCKANKRDVRSAFLCGSRWRWTYRLVGGFVAHSDFARGWAAGNLGEYIVLSVYITVWRSGLSIFARSQNRFKPLHRQWFKFIYM